MRAAVDLQRGAGHVAGRGRGEVDDRRGDLLGGAEPADGLAGDEVARAAAGSGAAASSRPTHGVSTVPGQTQLTRMPSAAQSAAIARVSAYTAPLLAP